MDVESTIEDGFVIIKIDDEINLYNAPELKQEFTEAISGSNLKIIVNLAAVRFIDSSGLGALIMGHNEVRDAGGAVKLVNVADSVKRIFKLTSLDSMFEMTDSVDEAKAAFT